MEFLKEAKDAFAKDRYDMACFLAEQAVQLYLKAVLLKIRGDYPRVHQIRLLVARLIEVLPESKGKELREFVRRFRAELSELEDIYIMARYSLKTYTVDDAREVIDIAKKTIEFIRRVVGDI